VKSSVQRLTNFSKIGLISDTHGLLRPEAVEVLRGSELILHAGDVGKPEIIETLKQIAPVIAIRGNVDTAAWAKALPETVVVEESPVSIYMLHNLQYLDLKPATAGFHIVVSGHTHKPLREERDGVLYINPGSAGPRRFDLPVTVARLNLGVTPWDLKFIELKV
jgi:putative phosphoesterase